MQNGLPIFQVDAFTSKLFFGNPAAVVPLEEWLPDQVLQSIASENNLSETAFLQPSSEKDVDYDIRWFTPTQEVDLCGHATLASAFVVFNFLGSKEKTVRLYSKFSGHSEVSKADDMLIINFPNREAVDIPRPTGLEEALGVTVKSFLKAAKNMAVLENAAAVRSAQPDLDYIANLPGDGLILTAAGDDSDCDCVSRYFAPHAGIPEDPVTGSAHCTIVPYWAKQLNKEHIHARQVSQRGGELFCQLAGDRVFIKGAAVLYMQGTIHIFI